MEYVYQKTYCPKKYKHKYTNQKNMARNTLTLKKLIFPPIAEHKLSQLMIDDESIKYITFANTAQEITNAIMNNLIDFPCPEFCRDKKWEKMSLINRMKSLVITDMTAGVGGNVLNFAKYFKYVNAIEIDDLRYNYLNKNIDLYGFRNVNCYHCNSLDMLIDGNDIVQDIIFFDPPWGGKDYKLHDSLRLVFENLAIESICKVIFQKSYNKMIILKLPNNYDFDYLQSEMIEFQVFKYSLDRMSLIVIKNY